MSDDPHDQLLLQIRGAVACSERSLIADRMRRGRQAKLRSGRLLPWTRAPYGYILDAECPRDPSRVRLDPLKAAIVQQIFACYTDLQTPASLYMVAKRLRDDHIPTPTGSPRWNVASKFNRAGKAVQASILPSHPLCAIISVRAKFLVRFTILA